jgi:hypothetical protein
MVRLIFARWAPGWVSPQRHPGLPYTISNLGSSFLAGVAGGYVVSWFAAADPLRSMLALAIVVLVIGSASVLQARSEQPIWYQLALVAIGPMGVVAGTLLRLRVNGSLP